MVIVIIALYDNAETISWVEEDSTFTYVHMMERNCRVTDQEYPRNFANHGINTISTTSHVLKHLQPSIELSISKNGRQNL